MPYALDYWVISPDFKWFLTMLILAPTSMYNDLNPWAIHAVTMLCDFMWSYINKDVPKYKMHV